MVQLSNSPEWQVIGETVRGASHLRTGLPNQDALKYHQVDSERPLIVALSDGHGSVRSFRSGVGARLAVEQAVKVIEELLAGDDQDSLTLSMLNQLAEEQLPKLLHRQWRRAVDRHWEPAPFSDDELTRAGDRSKKIEENHYIAYGTTLLAVAVTKRFILYLQLGDGDILAISSDGQPTRPLARDERLFANETTSLSSSNAWQDMQVAIQVLDDTFVAPALIMLATDGYANSFRTESAFLEVGPDFLAMIRRGEATSVKENLADWLSETSSAGSGDDITLAIIYRLEALSPRPFLQNNSRRTRKKNSPAWRRRPKNKKKKARKR